MDGGTPTPYSQLIGHENADLRGEFQRGGRRLRHRRGGGVQHRRPARPPDRSSCMGRVFWRSALMIITILPLLIWRRREAWIDARNAGGALFASAIGIAGSMVAFILALGLAPVANVLIVFGATPFITALARPPRPRRAAASPHALRDGRRDRGPRDVGRGFAGSRRARRHGGRLHRRALHERQLRGRPPSPPCRHDAGAASGRRDLRPDLGALRPPRHVPVRRSSPGCWRWGPASSRAGSALHGGASSAFRPAAPRCLACWSWSWARSGCG